MATQNEPASPRKLQRVRDLGDTPTSAQLAPALALGAGLCVLPSLVFALWQKSSERLKWALTAADTDVVNLAHASRLAIIQLVEYCVPLLAAVTIAQLVARTVEARVFVPTGARGKPTRDVRRPIRFMRRLTWRAALAQASSLLLSLVVGVYSLGWIRDHAVQIAASLGTLRGGLQLLAVGVMQLLWFAFFAWVAVGSLSLAIDHRLWLVQHRMSHEEKLLEQKETEGDPSILSERARARQQILSESSSWSFSEATLVIHDANRLALVLHYNPSDGGAPRLLGVGTADLAATIIAEAHRFEIPIVAHATLARALAEGSVGEAIGEKHYAAVAEVMSDSL